MAPKADLMKIGRPDLVKIGREAFDDIEIKKARQADLVKIGREAFDDIEIKKARQADFKKIGIEAFEVLDEQVGRKGKTVRPRAGLQAQGVLVISQGKVIGSGDAASMYRGLLITDSLHKDVRTAQA